MIVPILLLVDLKNRMIPLNCGHKLINQEIKCSTSAAPSAELMKVFAGHQKALTIGLLPPFVGQELMAEERKKVFGTQFVLEQNLLL